MIGKLASATRIDYTAGAAGFHKFKQFDEDVVRLLRGNHTSRILVVLDQGYSMKGQGPHIVHDHLNLSGSNPLVGPNPPCGARFPVINDVYMNALQTLDPKRTFPLRDPFSALPTTVTAGLKAGLTPTVEELELIESLGADSYCYHMVPTMLVAAHAGWKVFGILIPEGETLDTQMATNLRGVMKS